MTRSAIRRFGLALAVLAGAARAPGASLSGRILDSDGNPVAGARVVCAAYRSEEETLSDETAGSKPAPLAAATTGADGRFSFALKPGAPHVALRLEPSAVPGAILPGPLDPDGGVLADLVLPRPATVAGQVFAASGPPLEGARVTVLSRADAAAAGDVLFFAEALSGAGGAFLVSSAPSANRVIRARAAGFVPVSRVSPAGQTRERFDLKTGGGLHGTVVDGAGHAAAGAIVATGESAVRADAAGRYRLSGVPAGGVEVEAFLGDDRIARRGPVTVQKGADAEVNLTLARAAAIEGSVIDQGTRQPIAGARVAVAEPGSPFQAPPPRRVTRTDSRGVFRARGLPAGRYTVEASGAGYLPSALPGVTAAVAAAGSARLALEPAAAIAGRVMDEKKQPVRGARVRLTRRPGGNGRFRRAGPPAAFFAEREAVTGPDGAFRLEGLVPVTAATIEALHAGFAPAQLPGVSLKSGRTVRDIELVLRAGRAAHGSVVDESGHAIPGAEVRVSASDTRGLRFAAFRPGAPVVKPDAVSGADGSFLVAGLAEGEYQVAVAHDGYAAKTVPVLRVAGKDPVTWAPIALARGVGIAGTVRDEQSLPIVAATVQVLGQPELIQTDGAGRFRVANLTAGRPATIQISAEGYARTERNATPPADDLSIVLGKTGTIRGRVEDAASGSPIADFTIARAAGPGGRGFGGPGAGRGGPAGGPNTLHSDDGTFELTNVPPGTWTVSGSAGGYRRADVSGIEVPEGGTKEGVVLSLKHGSSLAGRVIDAGGGNPIANATVSWQTSGSSARGPGPGFAAAAAGQSATTDADGRFTLDSLPDGKITITASQPDFLAASRDVDPTATADLVISLGTGGEISGVVLDEGGGAPVVGADVRLSAEGDSGGAGGSQAAQSGASGAFVFDYLSAGRYQISAQSKAGTSAPQDLVLEENQQMDGVRITVASGVLVDGSVSGLPDGQLGGVSVTASADGYRATATTGSDGKFTLKDVPTGIVRFSASTSFRQGRTSASTVEIPDDATEMPVDIAFEGLSRLSGQVTRGGKGVSALSVTAAPDPPDGSGQRSSALTDGDGTYALEGLNDGNYQVSLTGQGTSYRRAFTISGDTNGDIALPDTTVSGTVTDAASGMPVEGAAIQIETGVETQAGAVKRGQTDSNGFYSITSLDPGDYQVTARAAAYQLKTRALSIDGGSAQADFALDKGTGLPIQVADGLTGMPLGGINALAFGADGSLAFSGSVSLDGTGIGEIPSLQPGQYSVHVFSAGYAPQSLASATVPSNTIALAMTPGGRVEARSSVPIAGSLFDSSGAVVLLSPFRLDGSVSIAPPVTAWEHLAPGSYTLSVGSGDGAKSYPFTVEEGKTTELSLP